MADQTCETRFCLASVGSWYWSPKNRLFGINTRISSGPDRVERRPAPRGVWLLVQERVGVDRNSTIS